MRLITRFISHSFLAVLEGLLIATLVIGLIAGSALAAKGGGRDGRTNGSGTVALVLLDSTDGVAHRGQRVTFEVATTASDRPFVGLRCWQGSEWVYDGYVGYFPDYLWDPWFVLDSNYWGDGTDAFCTARLFYYDKRGNQKVLTSTDFAVAP